MKLRLPRIKWPWLLVHIPTAFLLWTAYYAITVGLTWSLVTGYHGFVIRMFTYVTDYIVIAIAVAVPVVWAILMSFNRFIDNKKDILMAQKQAKIDNTVVADTVNAELASKYWFGYLILGIFGAVICAGIALYITDVAAAKGYVAGTEEIALAAVVIGFGLELVADVKVINNLGDKAYFLRREQAAVEKFLNGDEPASDEEEVKQKSVDELVDDLIAQKILAMLGTKKH